jgi:hypothetical protein
MFHGICDLVWAEGTAITSVGGTWDRRPAWKEPKEHCTVDAVGPAVINATCNYQIWRMKEAGPGAPGTTNKLS